MKAVEQNVFELVFSFSVIFCSVFRDFTLFFFLLQVKEIKSFDDRSVLAVITSY